MRRVLFAALFGLFGCDDEEGGAGSSGSTGVAGSTSQGSSSNTTAASSSGGGSSTSTTGGTSSTGNVETSSSDSGDSSGSSEGGSSTGAGSAIGFAEIQVDLENMGGAQGAFPSCIDGVPCHNNPDRNVVLVANPTPAELMQNYQNILDAPGTPWVTPLDDSAQMLNEVSIPDDVRARWLGWIQAGAPFE